MNVKSFKKSKLLTIAIAVFVLAAGGIFSKEKNIRTGTIKGILSEINTRQPLGGAAIVLEGAERVMTTKLDGEFIFANVPVGSYSIKFIITGMRPHIITDIIVKSQRTTMVITTMPLMKIDPESVIVSATYFTQAPDLPSNRVNFSNEEIRRAPGSGGDVSRIISSLPSVAQVSDQANNLVVRGGSTNENLFIIDNILFPNIYHFPFHGTAGGAVSLINIDFIENVEFFAGGFSAIYGDRLSSVMNLRFREGNRECINSQVSLDFIGAGLGIEGPIPGKTKNRSRGSWMFAARHSYLDLLTDLMDVGAKIRYSDFQGKIVYNLSARSKLTILGVMGMDESIVTRDNAVKLGESTFGDMHSQERTIGFNWFWMWSDRGYSETSISQTFTRFEYDNRKTADDSLFLKNFSEEEIFHFRNVNYLNFNYAHKLKFGFEGGHSKSRYNYFVAPFTNASGQFIPEVNMQNDVGADKASFFAEYTLIPFSLLSLNLGMRADYFSHTGRTGFSPRSSLTLKLSDTTSLSAAAGIFRQNLPLLLLYRNEDNKDLFDPYSIQYSIGLNHLFGESTRLSVEVYHKSYRNFPIDPQSPSLCLLDDLFGFSFFGDGPLIDTGRAKSYGLEFVLQKKLKEKFYGMISGSWFRTRYEDVEGVWRDRIYDNRYIFAVQGGYKPDRKWEFSVRWLIAGGRPYSPFDISASEAVNSGIYDPLQINTKRMPAYHSLNLRFDRRLNFKGSNMTVYLSIWNAYNHKNTASYYWNEIENKPDFSYQFSILPVIGIEYEF